MAKNTVRALVKPELLVWARETAGYDTETAAKKLGTSAERVAAWEDAEREERPTIKQLQKMATVYKRPLSVFYLQEVPEGFQVLRDYRRLPGSELRSYSPTLLLEQRLANQRREQALELADELGIDLPVFNYMATLDEDAEAVGARVRKILGVTIQEQHSWPDARNAFNAWRQKIEGVGVMAFQMTRVPSDEVSGFAISHDVYPVIAINRKNTPHTRRIFSLLHEFAHLMLRRSGVSESNVDHARPPEEQRVEIFCNAVAAAAIMPREEFLTDQLVLTRRQETWRDDDIEALAQRFGASREAVVRRLHTYKKVNLAFYEAKREQYREERQRDQARQKEAFKEKDKPFSRNPPQDVLTDFGRPFIRLVLDTFHNDRITLSDVSSYLGVRVRHVPTIEKKMGLT